MALRVSAAAVTHRGSVRDRNEDCLAVGTWIAQHSMDNAREFEGTLAQPFVCVLADGMGGHAAGERASRLAAGRLSEILAGAASGQVGPAIHRVNAAVYAEMKSSADLIGMGATLVGLHADAAGTCIFNVGDSRAYRCEAAGLRQLSVDDSADTSWKPGSLFARSGVLTQSLGGSPEFAPVTAHLTNVPTLPGDTYLLCSDGLYETLDEEQIAELIGVDLKRSAEALLQSALRHFSSDNLSIALIRISRN